MTYGSESECATHDTTAPHKLAQVGIPNWVTNLISDWYTKLYVAVRWYGCISVYFKVNSGVSEGSILSPGLLTMG